MIGKFGNMDNYIRILTIPFVLMIIWSIIVFAVGVAGALDMEGAGSLLVGTSLGAVGSLIGMALAVAVGFNAAKHGIYKPKEFAIIGALFGLITSTIGGILSLAVFIFSVFTGTEVISGLGGLSVNIILDLLGIQLDMLLTAVVVIVDILLLIAISVITGAVLSLVGGVVTKKFLG